MSPAELCRATKTQTRKGLAQPSLWAIENGKTKQVKADTLFRIAAALNANPAWIKDGTGDPFDVSLSSGDADEAIAMFNALTPEKKAMIVAAIKAIS